MTIEREELDSGTPLGSEEDDRSGSSGSRNIGEDREDGRKRDGERTSQGK
jgi:hypothetical protein